jgi:hypothetical protein
MSVFTDPELAYLTGERHLARIGTVGKDGEPCAGHWPRWSL